MFVLVVVLIGLEAPLAPADAVAAAGGGGGGGGADFGFHLVTFFEIINR